MISSSTRLLDSLRKHRLLTEAQLAQLPRQCKERSGNARLFSKALIQRGWLSVYQVNQLLEGKAHELAIGPYHVLDRLGQGGLSTVYKAKHREHGNLVAIKMIKPEVFASEVGRQQFLQEVEAMARLDHANVVQFCDADEWNDTYYFAMEYVEGTDLGKVVRLSGALPVWETCDYIRQAALGLQHAYERNLIHRDIKPVNLFLTHISEVGDLATALFATRKDPARASAPLKPLIKILDWGLASLRTPKGGAVEQQEFTGSGIIGTADYLSPEQARNASTVDIRGDIYSLGCTMYYLLTGQAPFPDGTLMQKILQHQQAEPTDLGAFRDDVPAEVSAILKRMMAKKPEDRFQTPASAALALMRPGRRPKRGSSGALSLRHTPTPRARDDTPIPPTLGNRASPRLPGDTSGPGSQ